jgi:hypothetical protein
VLQISNEGCHFLVLVFLYVITHNLARYTDRASGLLTASKHVRDVVNYWMTAGPRNSHTTDQKVGSSNLSGRASLFKEYHLPGNLAFEK